MSGTSRDGMDAAALLTDGKRVLAVGPAATVAYTPHQAAVLARLIECAQGQAGGQPAGVDSAHVWRELPCLAADSALRAEAEDVLLEAQEAAVLTVLKAMDEDGGPSSSWPEVSLLGSHGHTILHKPSTKSAPGSGYTVQLNVAERLSERLSLPVVHDFRSEDVARGGQGAPLAPVFHAAMAAGGELATEGAVAFLNIGGVSNVSLVSCLPRALRETLGTAGGGAPGDLIAFDCGPGNALVDDWVSRSTATATVVDEIARSTARTRGYDVDGRIAAAGTPDAGLVDSWAERDMFARIKPPKSLDRDDYAWVLRELSGSGVTLENGAATLTLFTARTVANALSSATAAVKSPSLVLVCGGGVLNPTLMERLRAELARTGCSRCEATSDHGWDPSAVEAQAFGFMAVRSVRGLPLSFPGTTGVGEACTGGRVVGSSG